MSLLELMAAATITATLMGSSVVLLRSSYAIWQAHDADHEQAENAHAVLRHLVRTLRQATSVTSITAPSVDAGAITLVLGTGDSISYTADAPGAVWRWADPGPTASALAPDIEALNFTGYEGDGVTIAGDPSEVHLVKAAVTITMPTGSTRTVSCSAWVRSW